VSSKYLIPDKLTMSCYKCPVKNVKFWMSGYKCQGTMSRYTSQATNVKLQTSSWNVKLKCQATMWSYNVLLQISRQEWQETLHFYKCQVTMSYYKYRSLNTNRHCILTNVKLQMSSYNVILQILRLEYQETLHS